MIIFNALQTSMNGGIGRYSYELSKEMYKQHENEIKIIIRKEDLEKFNFAKIEDLIILSGINSSIKRNLYEQFVIPRIIKKKYPDAIVHYPDSMAPLFMKNPVVITVHDMAYKSMKNIFTAKSVIWKNFITNLSIKKAEKIIAITNFTKSEILKYYKDIDESKISVVYNGFNSFDKETINYKNIRKEIRDIDKNYILTVSTISPRKNIDGLIKAFKELKDDINLNLVIAGNNGWMYENIYDSINNYELQNRVILTGKVNDDELKYLYKNAKIFVYISFYEGFGLPPLEAMSYDVPCIVSNVSSLPEVVGDYAIKVDPRNIKSIAKEIKKIIEEGYNIDKDKMHKYLENFSWIKCAINTYKVY